MDARIVSARQKIEIYRAGVAEGGLANCPIRNVVQNIFGKCSSLLLMALAEKPYRFESPIKNRFHIGNRHHLDAAHAKVCQVRKALCGTVEVTLKFVQHHLVHDELSQRGSSPV